MNQQKFKVTVPVPVPDRYNEAKDVLWTLLLNNAMSFQVTHLSEYAKRKLKFVITGLDKHLINVQSQIIAALDSPEQKEAARNHLIDHAADLWDCFDEIRKSDNIKLCKEVLKALNRGEVVPDHTLVGKQKGSD